MGFTEKNKNIYLHSNIDNDTQPEKILLERNPTQSVWYDASKIDTLFQDTNKTTPVQNNGDPVSIIEDLTGNGNDLSVNGGIYHINNGKPYVLFDDTSYGSCYLNYTVTYPSVMSFGTVIEENQSNQGYFTICDPNVSNRSFGMDCTNDSTINYNSRLGIYNSVSSYDKVLIDRLGDTTISLVGVFNDTSYLTMNNISNKSQTLNKSQPINLTALGINRLLRPNYVQQYKTLLYNFFQSNIIVSDTDIDSLHINNISKFN